MKMHGKVNVRSRKVMHWQTGPLKGAARRRNAAGKPNGWPATARPGGGFLRSAKQSPGLHNTLAFPLHALIPPALLSFENLPALGDH